MSATVADLSELLGQFAVADLSPTLERSIRIVEMLNKLDKLPPRCLFIALPLKIKRGSGSPIRPIALVPRDWQPVQAFGFHRFGD